MAKKYILHLLILFCFSIGGFSFTSAEELNHTITEVNDIKKEEPPPISRNPFVSTPYGSMYRNAVKNISGPGLTIRKDNDKPHIINKGEGIGKDKKIKGVLLDGNYPVALIGESVVKVGDSIGKYKVTDISRDGVSLSDGDRVIMLSLE